MDKDKMDVVTRLFKVRRTCLQMLIDRGYIVNTDELNFKEDQFRAKFCRG